VFARPNKPESRVDAALDHDRHASSGSPIAQFLSDNAEVPVVVDRLPLPIKLKQFMALIRKPIDDGLVDDLIPGSSAYQHLGSSCDTSPLRGYGIVGNHEPVNVPNVLDTLVRAIRHESLDDYLGEANDVMSGLHSQWGRGSGNFTVPFFP